MTSPQPSLVRRGSSLKKLPRLFYLRPTLTVAKDLLGKYLVRKINKHLLIGKIVEVEAYLGKNDPASHAYRGRTKRNDVMFWKGGHLYVYFTYGMHYCANVVTEEEGKGRAVLLRAVEPINGIEVMMKNRHHKRSPPKADGLLERWSNNELINLTNGPAKLCKAFGLKREQNGTDLLGDDIYLTDGEHVELSKIRTSKRVGITNGTDKKWRFYIKSNRFVSKIKIPQQHNC